MGGGGGVLHPQGKTTLKTSMVSMFVYVSHVTLRATGWSARRFLLFLLYFDQLPLPPMHIRHRSHRAASHMHIDSDTHFVVYFQCRQLRCIHVVACVTSLQWSTHGEIPNEVGVAGSSRRARRHELHNSHNNVCHRPQ